MAATPDELVAPPQEVPGVYTDAVAKLHKTARNLMVLKGIPWFIQATLSDEGFVSMEDLATRWDPPDRARETAPGELGFAPNNHHYTAGEPGPGADQSSGQVHHGDGQVQPGLQCALQRRAAHLAADGQVHEQHPGAAGLANEDHVGSGHQTEPGPAHRPIVLLLGGQMVDPLGAVVEEIQGLGGVPRDGLPDPHD